MASRSLCRSPCDVILMHYDSDYEHIASVTSQPMQWVVPRGSIP